MWWQRNWLLLEREKLPKPLIFKNKIIVVSSDGSGNFNQPKNRFKACWTSFFSIFCPIFGIIGDFWKFCSAFGKLYFEKSSIIAKNEERPSLFNLYSTHSLLKATSKSRILKTRSITSQLASLLWLRVDYGTKEKNNVMGQLFILWCM